MGFPESHVDEGKWRKCFGLISSVSKVNKHPRRARVLGSSNPR